MMAEQKLRLVVVPSDPIAAYEAKGTTSRLELNYYNPTRMFDEVFALSPREQGERVAYGMRIIGIADNEFANAVRELKPAVVRAYGGYWATDLVCHQRVRGVPVVVSVHDPNPQLLHSSVRYADLVLCTSRVVQDRVIAKGVKSERTRILPNWIDTKIFQPQSDPATKASLDSRFPTGKRILHVGRKGVEKNLDTLLEALQHLPPDYSVIFIGRGNVEHYQNLARSLGVYDRTFWIDSVPNHELPVWYSWCDCFCVASRWEGFGVVYIEAAACGAPIVTSNIAPMNAYLSHGVSAHLVSDYENPTALAEAVHRVCEDRDYRAALSAGAVKAGSLFSRETIQPKEAAAYRSLIDNPPQSNASRLAYRIWRAKYSSSRFMVAPMPRRVLHRIREVLK